MDRDLVAVKVRVERRTDERMKLYRVAFYEDRLECLNAEAVKRWRAVQKNILVLDNLFKDCPHLGDTFLYEAVPAADVERKFFLKDF